MLASIQKIISVDPIENADRIEKVKVLGWDCIVRKGIFSPGDLCVYIEIDTIIPKSLLDETYSGDEKVRLKTIKMKGQISQGLVLPISTVTEVSHSGNTIYKFACDDSDLGILEGKDVSDGLEIIKYEKTIPANLQGLVKGNFPGFLTKTDEVKAQSDKKLLKSLVDKSYYITSKVDGTSATFYKFEDVFGVCSRNMEMKEGESIYWRMAKKYNLENIIPENVCIQGEIAGPGIQGNKLDLKEPELFIFNIYTIRPKENFEYQDLLAFCKYHNLQPVQIVFDGIRFNRGFEELMEIADNLSYPNGGKAEGIVVRSKDQSISFKVVSNKFLLKYGE